MPGQLVDVGGYKMHINCTGQGTPVVILDSGLGDSYISWSKVQPQIAKFTRVCSYDRAGLGYSDASPRPRISKVIAEELHTLLHNAGIDLPPYILVGHSMGGFDVCMFASLYRSEVAGMVLVDSSHPEQREASPSCAQRYGCDLGAGAGVPRIHHAFRFAAPPRVCAAMMRGSRRRVQFSQRSRGRGRDEDYRESAAQTAPRVRWGRCHSPCSRTILTSPRGICPRTWTSLQARPGVRCKKS